MIRVALVVLASTIAVRCGTEPTGPVPVTVLTLHIGDTRSVHGLTVTFAAVLSDSRCPLDVVCVHAGDAVAEFRIGTRRDTDRVELWLRDPEKRVVPVDRDAVVEFEALEPYPKASTPANPAAYVATVKIRPR